MQVAVAVVHVVTMVDLLVLVVQAEVALVVQQVVVLLDLLILVEAAEVVVVKIMDTQLVQVDLA